MITERRELVAIMFTDLKGYSKLMEENEATALRVLEAQSAIIKAAVEKHEGRIVNSIGDGTMCEFKSAVKAVACALEIQEEIREYNKEKGEQDKIMLRIGIHLGDVIVKCRDVFGEGVNIASRIVNIAEGGDICVSHSVVEQVHHSLDVSAISLGAKKLKNIKGPVEIFRILEGRKGLSRKVPGRVFLISFLTTLFVSAGISVGLYWVYSNSFIVVPELRGITATKAGSLLADKKVTFYIKGERYDTLPHGTILTQDPLPYSRLKKGIPIGIVVSKFELPNLAGLTLSRAKDEIVERKLKIGTVTESPSDSVPEGIVISTNIQGKQVNIVLSIGNLKAPNLKGMTVRKAKAVLDSMSLTLGKVYRTCNIEYAFHIIIKQDPSPGTSVKKETPINITVNYPER